MAEKLVRDLLVSRIPQAQLRVEADAGAIMSALQAKLSEELRELADSAYQDAGEFADVIEVLYALARRNGISESQVEAVRIAKLQDRGGFEQGLMYNPEGY